MASLLDTQSCPQNPVSPSASHTRTSWRASAQYSAMYRIAVQTPPFGPKSLRNSSLILMSLPTRRDRRLVQWNMRQHNNVGPTRPRMLVRQPRIQPHQQSCAARNLPQPKPNVTYVARFTGESAWPLGRCLSRTKSKNKMLRKIPPVTLSRPTRNNRISTTGAHHAEILIPQ